MSEPRIVYGVYAEINLGVSYEFLGAYSSLARAQVYVDAQDERLREVLKIWEIEIDRHPEHDFWKVPGVGRAIPLVAPADVLSDEGATGVEESGPHGVENALHLFAGLAEDALPPDGTTVGDQQSPPPTYEPDDGPLIAEQLRAIQEAAGPVHPVDLRDTALFLLLEQADRDVREGRTVPAADVIACLREQHAPNRVRLPVSSATGGMRLGSLMSDIGREAGGLTDAEARAFERNAELDDLRLRVSDLERQLAHYVAGDPDMQRVLTAAEALSGDRARAEVWLDVPLPEYDGLTPRELVHRGRADTVLRHIGQIQSGSSG